MAKPNNAPDPQWAYEKGFIDGMQKQMLSRMDRAVNAMHRQWVGLTADEMESLYQQATYMDNTDHIHMLMMAEAKLKEKNT